MKEAIELEETLFYELIQISIGTRKCFSRTPSFAEWTKLFMLSRKHSVLGICFNGVQRLFDTCPEQLSALPSALRLKWIGVTSCIQDRNELLNDCCINLQRQLKALGIRSCILKGQGIAANYDFAVSDAFKLSTLRQSGDIDVWVEGGVETVASLCKTYRHPFRITEQHADIPFFSDVEVEVHFKPTMLYNPLLNRRLQMWLRTEAPLQFANEKDGLVVPTAGFNLVYLLIHILRHLFSEGVGLRQFMDYYFVLNNVDTDTLNKAIAVLKDLGLTRFFGSVIYVLQVCYGLGKNLSSYSDSVHGQFLLQEIMLSGNMGHFDSRHNRRAERNRLSAFIDSMVFDCRFLTEYPSETLFLPYTRIINRLWINYTEFKYR